MSVLCSDGRGEGSSSEPITQRTNIPDAPASGEIFALAVIAADAVVRFCTRDRSIVANDAWRAFDYFCILQGIR